MKMQIGRWGNSLAVRLPKDLVDRFDLKEGGQIETGGIEEKLEAARTEERQRQREEALHRIAETRWTLPKDWHFDRDEANAR